MANSSGDQVAGQITGGWPAPCPYRGGLWRDGTFIPLPIPESFHLIHINDKGQVVGGARPAGLNHFGDLSAYLPAGDYGLSAGVHPIEYPESDGTLAGLQLSGHGEIYTSDA